MKYIDIVIKNTSGFRNGCVLMFYFSLLKKMNNVQLQGYAGVFLVSWYLTPVKCDKDVSSSIFMDLHKYCNDLSVDASV